MKNNKKIIVKAIEKIFIEEVKVSEDLFLVSKSKIYSLNDSDPSEIIDDEISTTLDLQQDWNISEIKKNISIFAEQGKLSNALADVLHKDGFFAPVEFECLDYKEDIDNTPYDRAKLIKRIVSFIIFTAATSFLAYLKRNLKQNLKSRGWIRQKSTLKA